MSAMPSGLTRRLLLAFQLQLHRLIHGMAVVSRPPGHLDDDAEVLRRFLTISFGLLVVCRERDGVTDGVARLLQLRRLGHVCEYDVEHSAAESGSEVSGRCHGFY